MQLSMQALSTTAMLHPTDLLGLPWLSGQPATLPPSALYSTCETYNLLSKQHVLQFLVSGWQGQKRQYLLQNLRGMFFDTAFESLCSLYEVFYQGLSVICSRPER